MSVLTDTIPHRSVQRSPKIVYHSESLSVHDAHGHKSTSCSTKKYQIALDSGATTHVLNAPSRVEVMYAPSTIKTAHLGDTVTSNLSANVGIRKDVIVMEEGVEWYLCGAWVLSMTLMATVW